MGRLSFREKVIEDVDEIARYIAKRNLDAGLRFYDAARDAFDLLAAFPGAGPRFEPTLKQCPQLRFWPITKYENYLVLYEPIAGGVEILRVTHGSRDILRVLSED